MSNIVDPISKNLEKVFDVKKTAVSPVVIDPGIQKKINKVVRMQKKFLAEEEKKGLWYNIVQFFNNWIWPNKFLLIFLMVIAIVLYYRYDGIKEPPRPVPKQNLQLKVQRITQNSIQLKDCGHPINYPCVCNYPHEYVKQDMNGIELVSSSVQPTYQKPSTMSYSNNQQINSINSGQYNNMMTATYNNSGQQNNMPVANYNNSGQQNNMMVANYNNSGYQNNTNQYTVNTTNTDIPDYTSYENLRESITQAQPQFTSIQPSSSNNYIEPPYIE
jgi:hypothetical protein